MSAINSSSPKNSTSGKPVLPPNVSIFSPTNTQAIDNLLNGRIFTRLSVSTSTTPSQIATTLKEHQDISDTFCLSHGNFVLLFDGGEGEEADIQDTHHEHFRTVCLAFKDRDIGLDVAGCIFDTTSVLDAGFQLDRLNDGAVLVIDLMEGDEDEDSDEE